MKKYMIISTLGLLFFLLILINMRFSASAWAITPLLRVPQDYHTIQKAVYAAHSGDTIFVSVGTYNEHLVIDQSNITMIGEDSRSTVINGSGADSILLKASNITIAGFTIREGYSGVQMSPWTHGHQIRDCIILDNDFGIRGHYDVHSVSISNNIITLNKFVGIEMCFYNSTIKENIISINGRGEFIELSAGIQIVEAVYDTTISSDNNTVIENIIENNFNGILPTRYSQGNLFYHNTFQHNTNQLPISVSACMSSNTFAENYWSDYSGEDNNGDGFGDLPYKIDALSADPRPLMSPFHYWKDPIAGDVNKDMKVNIRDIAIAAKAFGTYPNHTRWLPNADIDLDKKVDIKDIALIAKNFGKHWDDN